jgi:hypothetical protein
MNKDNDNNDEKRLVSTVLKLNAKILGLVLGLLSGIFIFIVTNWLVIKGGKHVGSHLQLLSQYFIGYRVTFFGSIIGFFYCFAIGGISGALIGWIYNKIVIFKNHRSR